MARSRPTNLSLARLIASSGLACVLASATLGCSSQTTQRASLEFRPLVLDPNGTGVASGSSAGTRSGSTTLTSVPTD